MEKNSSHDEAEKWIRALTTMQPKRMPKDLMNQSQSIKNAVQIAINASIMKKRASNIVSKFNTRSRLASLAAMTQGTRAAAAGRTNRDQQNKLNRLAECELLDQPQALCRNILDSYVLFDS